MFKKIIFKNEAPFIARKWKDCDEEYQEDGQRECQESEKKFQTKLIASFCYFPSNSDLLSLQGELNKSLLKVINKHLMKLPITSIIPGSSANEYVDQILTNVQNYVKDNNLDPMVLPDYKSNFTKEIMYVTFNGEAKMYDGRLWGISTIHRTDECELNTTRTTITVSAHLGLNDLKLYYKGHAKFMSFGPTITAGGNIKKVDFYFKIQQTNKKGEKPDLKEFEIIELSTIWIQLSGLGPLTWILKWLLTGISKLVEDFIVEKMTNTIKEYMANEFEKYSFPV
ncbi:hypothetical protein AVEN_232991-1 [Araneus ventricosus]|uniref:Circadian clock-controlled protein n=1 Tax=Araneus ventricosus TaxID=182803 RepID=A0A4Y2S3Z2_ARAVE|nr:hypothetical protein AVEN_232991-1 [Araneus ventricosus]